MGFEYRAKVSDEAKSQIDEICDYIKIVLLNPDAAKNFLFEFETKKERLGCMPHGYPKSPYDSDFRMCMVKNYIAFFLIDEEKKEVVVECVSYGPRNHGEILPKFKNKFSKNT